MSKQTSLLKLKQKF